MRLCRVVGPLVATVKHPAFAGCTLLCVQPTDEHGSDVGRSFVAVDHVRAGVGDRVLVLSEGGGVGQILGASSPLPIRSLIVAFVDAIDVGAKVDNGAGAGSKADVGAKVG